MDRAFRRLRLSRGRLLALLAAFCLLANQGVIGIPMACGADPDAATASMDGCAHCHPHDGTAGCLGIHGCHSPTVILARSISPPSLVEPAATLPAGPAPRIASLTIAPPLRPPAA